jgi:sugar phosphate permease
MEPVMRTKRAHSSYRWLVLLLATFAQAGATFATYGIGSLAPFWQEEFHLSQLETGLFISAVNIGPLLSMIWIGNLLDYCGERHIISMGSILLGITMWGVSRVDDYLSILILLVFAGVWYGTAQPGGSKVVIQWFGPGERGLAMGIRQAAIPTGGAAAGLLLPAIAIPFGWQMAVTFQAGFTIIAGVLFWLIYRDPVTITKKEKKKSKIREQFHLVARNKSLYPILFAGFVLVSVQMILLSHLIPYLSTAFSICLPVAGYLFSITQFAGVIGRVTLSWMSDRVWQGNRRQPLILALYGFLIGIVFLQLAAGRTPLFLLALLCGWIGFFGLGWYSLFIVEVAERAAPEAVGFTVSYALTSNQIAIILAPSIFGFLVDWQQNYFLAWSGLAISILLSIGWLSSASKKRQSPNEPE